MGNNVVKSIFIAALLVLLSFSVGISAAEDVKGAGMIIAVCCVLFAVLWMQDKIWLALFYVPVLVWFGFCATVFGSLPFTYVVAIGVMCALILHKMRGRVRFEWRSLPNIDIPFFVLVALVAYSLYRFPVLPKSITSVIGINLEYSGGGDYLRCFLALLGYLVYSVTPIDLKVLGKHVKYIVKIAFVVGIIVAISSYIFRSSPGSMHEEEMSAMESRFHYFSQIGMATVLYLIGTKRFREIFTSIRYIVALLAACVGVLLSGSRGSTATLLIQGLFLMFIRREAAYLLGVLVAAYGMVFVVVGAGMMDHLPYGIQRISKELPGIELKGEAIQSAEHSTKMRDELERLGFDPSSGYIKNYVWGDGIATEYAQMMRVKWLSSGETKRSLAAFLQRNAMQKSSWHHGMLNIIHPIGYVGLAVVMWLSAVTFIYVYIVLRAYINHPVYPLLVVILPSVIYWLLNIYARLGSGGLAFVFNYSMMAVIMTKVFYCEGVKNGLIVPVMKRKSYIPLAVQERQHEENDLPEYPLPRKLKKTLSK